MRQFTLVLFVCASIVLGAPVQAQEKDKDKPAPAKAETIKVEVKLLEPAKPPAPPVTKAISATVRLAAPLTLAGESVLTQGSVIGATPEGWSVPGIVLLEDGIELPVPSKRFLSLERLQKSFKLPTGAVVPKGTDVATGSLLIISADYAFPPPLIAFGSGAIEPGVAAEKEDLTVEALLQKNRIKGVALQVVDLQSKLPAVQAAAGQVRADAKLAAEAKTAAQQAKNEAQKILTDVEAQAKTIRKDAMDGARSVVLKANEAAAAAKIEAERLLKDVTAKAGAIRKDAVDVAKAEAMKVAKAEVASQIKPVVDDLKRFGDNIKKVTDDLAALKAAPAPAPAPTVQEAPVQIDEGCYRGLWITKYGYWYVHTGGGKYERRQLVK